MVNLDLAVRVAQTGDHARLSNLLYFESHVHRHLDWRAPLDWLGVPEYWVAVQNGLITAALACPPDPESIAWIRLFVRSSSISAEDAWSNLWRMAQISMAGRHGLTFAAIVINDWFHQLLSASGFISRQNIVLLEHTAASFPERAVPAGVSIRPMFAEDLPLVAQLDAQAFAPLWRNSLPSLQAALSQAGPATVAMYAGNIVGYQISTKNTFGVHLARLAVSPDFQGRMVGYALTQDLLRQVYRLGLFRLTVNTQSDNISSLALYKKIGFVLTGEQYPVLTYQLS